MSALGRGLDELLPERSKGGPCTGKILYHHDKVRQMAKWLRRQGVRGLTAYRCKKCRAWHLGNAPGQKGKE